MGPRRAQPAERLELTVVPVTRDRWPALEDLLATGGPCGRCWCMYWRIGSAWRNRPADDNRHDFRKIVQRGPAPGLIALHGNLAVGWCQLTPRTSLPWLDRNWRLAPVDDKPVMALSCFYVRIGYRRRGVTTSLIEAAVECARKAGVPALEAYPLDAAKSPSASGTGFQSTFARAGFRVIARRSPERPVMRYEFRQATK